MFTDYIYMYSLFNQSHILLSHNILKPATINRRIEESVRYKKEKKEPSYLLPNQYKHPGCLTLDVRNSINCKGYMESFIGSGKPILSHS